MNCRQIEILEVAQDPKKIFYRDRIDIKREGPNRNSTYFLEREKNKINSKKVTSNETKYRHMIKS